MDKIIKGVVAAAALVAFTSVSAYADPVEGMWKRPASKGGTLEQIAPCGGLYCVTVRSGPHNGVVAGKFKKSGGKYVGEITDLDKKKTYAGTLTLQGASKLKMSGCVLKVLCKKEAWTRQ